jgi:hypothetical protein
MFIVGIKRFSQIFITRGWWGRIFSSSLNGNILYPLESLSETTHFPSKRDKPSQDIRSCFSEFFVENMTFLTNSGYIISFQLQLHRSKMVSFGFMPLPAQILIIAKAEECCSFHCYVCPLRRTSATEQWNFLWKEFPNEQWHDSKPSIAKSKRQVKLYHLYAQRK